MSGLIEIFFSPGKVFDRVRERSMFLPAVLAVLVVSALFFTVLVNLVGMETIARKQIESNPRMTANMTPEQMDQAIRAADTPARKAIGYCISVIGPLIVLLVVAGVTLGGLSAAGAKVNYLQVLGATSYAWLPYSLLNLIMSTIILFVTPDRDSLDFRNLIATNVGAFLDKETTGKAILSIANSIDVISFALIAFLSYGYSKVSRLSFTTCLMIVVGMWAIYVLGKAGVSAMF